MEKVRKTTQTGFSYMLFVCLLYVHTVSVGSIYLHGSQESYAKYPKWHACINASITLQFRTTQSEGTLLYVDDGGTYDFFEIVHKSGHVDVVLNIVDGREGYVDLSLGNNVNNGAWHTVEIRRNRMETTLIVDNDVQSEFAFGSDFHFGNSDTNRHVFLGGVPSHFDQDLHSLALPSVVFKPRFRGYIRNVIYGNCTCQRVRASMIGGEGVVRTPPEACEQRNPCTDKPGCICVSTDQGPECDCSEKHCVSDTVTHYRLPMDVMVGTTLINPSGLDATAFNDPVLIPGVIRNAIRLNTPGQYVRVTGPGHRYECFGDLTLCPEGYTLGFWVNFDSLPEGEVVYLSNGGHTEESHGVAMIYDRGELEFRYRRKDGKEWRTKSDNILPGRWYHIATSWEESQGLSLYVNGEFISKDINPEIISPRRVTQDYSEFMIGRGNDDTSTGSPISDRTMMMDEFNFWSVYKNAREIKEIGPFTHYHLPCDVIRGSVFADTTISNTIYGNPQLVGGKIDNAVSLDGRRKFVDLGDQSKTCLGNLSHCMYGLSMSGWYNFHELQDDMYYLDSGPQGFKLLYKDGKLISEFQQERNNWRTEWRDVKAGEWYFVEMSWHPRDGLKMYVDLQEVARDTRPRLKPVGSGTNHMYIGRANTDMRRERYAKASMDDLEFWYADRDRLIQLGYIQRGLPYRYIIHMEEKNGNQLVHDDLNIQLQGQARLATGKIGQGLYLNGQGQYANLGEHNTECLGNLDECKFGVLLGTWIKPGTLVDGTELAYTGENGIRIWVEGGKLKASFKTLTKEWLIWSNNLKQGQWSFLEYAWHPVRGLSMYVDNELVARTSTFHHRGDGATGRAAQNSFYLGRGRNLTSGSATANMYLDEFEYWYSSREYLLAFGYLLRGRPTHFHFDMDHIRNNRMVYPAWPIRVYGGRESSGKINNAIYLNGQEQYIDIGNHSYSCLGNLRYCRHGYTGSAYYNFQSFRENDYYFSTGGDGINMFYRNGQVHVTYEQPGKKWEVKLPTMQTDKWYQIQHTWHPRTGLQVYIDNKLVGTSGMRQVPSRARSNDNQVLVGRANPSADLGGRGKYGNVKVDNLEVWFATRDELIAHGHLTLPGDVEHLYIPLEVQNGNIVAHPKLRIVLYNGAVLVPGYAGNAASFNGNRQYMTLGEHKDNCMGNLERCKHGMTVVFYVNPRSLRDDQHFLAAGPYKVYNKGGKTIAEFRTPTKTWKVETNLIQPNKWSRIDLTWSEQKGLQMFVNNEKVAATTRFRTHKRRPYTDYNVYVGKASGDNTGLMMNGRVDEMEFWYAHRDTLVALGLIEVVVPTEPPPPTTTPAPTTPEPGPFMIFNGNKWVVYDLSELPEDYHKKNTHEQFLVQFRTENPNGLIWFSGNLERNMHLSLKNGALLLVVNYGEGNMDRFRVRPATGRLDNGEWHQALITRYNKQVTLEVDGSTYDQLLSQEPAMSHPYAVLVGGGPDPGKLTNDLVRRQFDGTIREIVIRGNSLPEELDLMEQFHRDPRPGYITINGPFPNYGPPPGEEHSAVTFRRPQSYLRLPAWDAPGTGVLEFKFRTTEPHNLVLYNGGKPGHSDFVAVEMHDGILYFVIDLGEGVFRYPFGDEPLNDNEAHVVRIERSGLSRLTLTLDGVEKEYSIPGRDRTLDLGTFMYLGAAEDSERLPWHLWTKSPKFWTRQPKYFVGCIWDMKMNEGPIMDLPMYASQQVMPGINEGCSEMPLNCVSNPCAHGTCYNVWENFICDCASTKYTGERCEKNAPIVTFDGSDFVRINFSPVMVTHTNDISLRFKTLKPDGLLFATANQATSDILKVELNDGKPVLFTNLGGSKTELPFGDDVADDRWHTLHIRRRADNLEAWIDSGEHKTEKIPSEGYTLDIDEILVAAMASDADPKDSFIGHMQNFVVNDYKFFELLGENDGMTVISTGPVGPTPGRIPIHKVTFQSPIDSFLSLPTLHVGDNFEIEFMFKTKEKNGMLLYNSGSNEQFFAVELLNGHIQLVYNDGTGPKLLTADSPMVNDNEWHYVKISRSFSRNFEVTVDEKTTRLPAGTRQDRMTLKGTLYVGGVPKAMYGNSLPEQISSEHGFKGCMASVKIAKRLVDLLNEATQLTSFIEPGCTAISAYCSATTCLNHGICKEGWSSFICDCNMTSYVGQICTDEAEGFRYRDYGKGIVIYEFEDPLTTNQDKLAFGFMTWFPNGTLVRIDSADTRDFIDLKLVNGHINAVYNIGEGTQKMEVKRQNFSDGAYHVVRFVRKGHDASLWVDDYPIIEKIPVGTSVRLFNQLSVIKVGGNKDVNGKLFDVFNGIIAGVYFNGIRVIDQGILEDINVYKEGDFYVASHPFFLPRPRPPTPAPVITQPPPIITPRPPIITPKPPVPPVKPEIPDTPKPIGTIIPLPEEPEFIPPEYVPYDQVGGGVHWEFIGGDGSTGGAGGTGGGGTGGGGTGGGAGAGGAGAGGGAGGGPVGVIISVRPGGAGVGVVAGGGPVSSAVVGGGATGAGAEGGGRAAAVAGGFLAVLLFGSSLVWALYKFKPGIIPLGGGGAKSSAAMNISAPRAATNYQLVKSQTSSLGAGYGRAAASNSTLASGGFANGTAVTVAAAATQTNANAGTQTEAAGANWSDYYSISAHASSASSAISAISMSASGMVSQGSQTEYTSSVPPLPPVVETQAVASTYTENQLASSFKETKFSTMEQSQSSSYQMHSLNQYAAQTPSLMAAEEIRVDCVLLTSNGRYVVTGSIYGPPQIWDMKTGDLVRTTGGEELSSTDLHLACNDTLMVGQVAEMTQIDPQDYNATSRLHHRKLQIWDFATGQPLEMAQNEFCTASCMMADGERMVLGRTEKFGGGTTIVIWDIVANEPVRKLRYDGSVGFADYISYLNLSRDNRYVIAGFQNSYDGNANFIIFDLTVGDYTNIEPKILALDAQAECTVILQNHEACTGTRQGELVIWSMRTGKPLRQLVSQDIGYETLTRRGLTPACAHAKEVKGMDISKDGKVLVTAAADCTLKVWNMDTEKLLHSLRGHTDEVWSCSLSDDMEMVASGSKDGNIRLWRTFEGSQVASFFTGVDVFTVKISKDKKTIVALGDRYGSRKLIMLQIVRTKTRSRNPSRATSPLGPSSRPTSPYRPVSPYRPTSPYR